MILTGDNKFADVASGLDDFWIIFEKLCENNLKFCKPGPKTDDVITSPKHPTGRCGVFSNSRCNPIGYLTLDRYGVPT